MNRQLLIIDDDPATHHLVSAHLVNSLTECISAWDGIEGVERAVESNPAAILLDMDMPKMNGMEVCRQLKANPQTRNIPIMFLSSDGAIGTKVQGIDMGAIDYVTKPFEPSELRARIRSVFRTANSIESVHAHAGIDEATGLWNRTFLLKQIEASVAAAARTEQLVSCCFVSIDRFDELAAKMGQPGGADLIREAARLVTEAVRLEDVVCRYDTRVIAVLGFVPNRKANRMFAERLRYCVAEIGLRSFFFEPETVTCSVGSVVSRASVGPVILRAAERALAEAQLDGNRIVPFDADAIASFLEDDPIN